jgi:ubiquinone/menaquinone biosynthesis C-methylase UbiE
MNLKELQNNWNTFGKQDPLWAIATWPEKKGNRWKLEEFFELGKKEVEGVLNHLKILGVTIHQGRALDFGCGVGRLTQALANHFDEVVGVDIAPSMIQLAKRYNRHGSRCQYYLNEVDDLTVFPGNGFDFIYTNIVLQHMVPSYSKSYIREFLRVLRPGGLLVFQLPSERTEKPARKTEHIPQADFRQSTGVLTDIKRMVKQCIPASLLSRYVSLRYPEKPIMEMHCIERQEIEHLLKKCDAEIINITEDKSAGPGFRGFRYTVAKPKDVIE